MMKKLHYKMYKSGKQWCYAALATVIAGAGLTIASGTTLAETNSDQATPVPTTQTIPVSGSTSANSNSTVQENSAQPATSAATKAETAATDSGSAKEQAAPVKGTDDSQKSSKPTKQTPSTPEKPAKSDKQITQKTDGVQQEDGNYYYYKDGVKQSNYFYTDPQIHITY